MKSLIYKIPIFALNKVQVLVEKMFLQIFLLDGLFRWV